MSKADWRAAHKKELLEKQRHIAQKLAQLREFQRLVRKWRPVVTRYQKWLAGIESSLGSSKWFSVTAVARMGSTSVQLGQMVAEFGQIGAPKAAGTGTATTSQSAKNQAASTELLIAKAGPLASMAPWELVWHIDPATSESVRQGKTGAAIINVLSSPFSSLVGVGFAKRIAAESKKLMDEHPEEFAALESGWKDTQKALEEIAKSLNGIDLEQLAKLERGLSNVLSDYESTYDGARGRDNTSATKLGAIAAGRAAKK